MSQEKLSLEQAAIRYNASVVGEYIPEQNTKAFIAGANFREAQLLEIVNKFKTEIEFDLNYHSCRTGDCPHEKQIECDQSIIESTKETLGNVNKALDEIGIV